MKNTVKWSKLVVLILLITNYSCSKIEVNNSTEEYLENYTSKNTPSTPPACFDAKRADLAKICPTENKPVCACEAINFANGCEAEKAGFIHYTIGNCLENSCFNEELKETLQCTPMYCPVPNTVCGCNGLQYSSYCTAYEDGITSWFPGPCRY